MKNNWKETTLGEVCKIAIGSTPSTKEASFWDGKISWITPKDLSGFNSVFIERGERNITEDGLKSSSAQILPPNTILFSSRAPIGYVAIAIKELTTNQGFKNIICDEKNTHHKYIYYWLKNRSSYIEKLSSGSTFSEASASLMRSLEIRLPSLPEQKQIAAVLSSLDDKIELLRKQNETLEKIAQGIFKEWFVNFAIDGKKVKLKNGVPEGWRVGKLGEIIDLQGGFVHDTEISGKSISKIAKMGVVDGKSWFNRNSVIDYSGKIDEKFKLKEDDLIICTRDMTQDRIVIGNIAIIPKDLANIGLYAGSNTWVIKSDYNKYFLFLLFREKSFRQHIIQSSKGTTIIMITRDSFLNCDVVIPTDESIENVMEEIIPIFEKIKNNNSQIQTLSYLRDMLLPKLMNGEIIVFS